MKPLGIEADSGTSVARQGIDPKNLRGKELKDLKDGERDETARLCLKNP